MATVSQLKPPTATAQRGAPTPRSLSHLSTSQHGLASAVRGHGLARRVGEPANTTSVASGREGAATGSAPGSLANRAGRTEGMASLSGAMKTARKPQRVLHLGGAGSGGASAAGPSTQQRPTTTLSSSSHLGFNSASAPLSASTSSTALRPLPPNVAATPSRARRLVTPTSSRDAPETFKEPPTPSTVRPRTRIVSSSSTSAGSSVQHPPSTLLRSLSKSTSSSTLLDSPRTVRPASRTLPKPPETSRKPSAAAAEEKGKKATLGGLGRPSAREPSTTTSRRRSSTGGRSVSAASTSSVQQTPLRQSTRTPSTSLAVSQTATKPLRPPAATTASTNRTLPASRRLGQAQSAIPVATASIAGGRTLRRPDSALSSTSSATLRKDPPSRPSSRTAAASKKAAVIRPRESLAASQTSRKSSWETVGSSARPSLTGRGELSQRTGEANQSWEMDAARRAGSTGANTFDDASYATPRKPSTAPAPGMILSPPSPNSSSTADLSTDDPNLSHFSHASFLSPLPSAPSDLSHSLSLPKPPPLPLARTLARTRSKPRESASLEDILRLGLLNSQMRRGSVLGPAGGGGDELELLLDEGSSRLMSEELASSIGAGDADVAAGVEPGEADKREKKDSPLTPWRGRVVSLSGSTSVRNASSPSASSGGSGLLASPSAGSDAGQGGGKVLLLRQSTTEASDLRRQVASLLAEVEQLKRAQAGRDVVHEEDEGERERVKELEQELEAARAREDELRRDWEEERRAMEEDLAELAAAAAVNSTTSTLAATPSPDNSAQVASLSATSRSLALSLQLSDILCAHRQTSTLYDAVQARAKMERDEVKGSLEALRVIAAGLRAWEGALQVV